jgi:predicted NBD/HSP70 family sugar kinase
VNRNVSIPSADPAGNDSAKGQGGQVETVGNAARLLAALHGRGGSATRAELTAQLDSGRSAISYALSDLVERGLVTVNEHPSAERGAGTGRGRPSHLVSVAPTSPIAVAVHLRVDTLDVSAVELGGRILRTEREPVEPSPDVDVTVRRIGRLIRFVADRAGRPCAGVGVSMPSPVRASDGYALAARHLNWGGVPIKELIAREIGEAWPLYVGNDANLAALAEHRHGAGRGARNLLYVTTEHVGIGGGLVTDGNLFTGASGYAMEVGHTTANVGGEPCRCGARGCLETEADPRALLRAAGRPDTPSTGLEYRARILLADAADGDRRALEAAELVSGRLGSGLAVLINLLDPDRIVLGGLLARLLALTPAPLADALREGSFLERAVAVPLVPAALDAPALLGAAELVLAGLFA